MSNIDKLASELKSLITESNDRKPKPYDTDAEVVRVEGDTLWVHIPGGVEETPIKKTINAIPGDKIKVHIAGGSAWISGNETAPPTDDRQAIYATNIAITADGKADDALNDAERAKLAADSAEISAKDAQSNASIAKTAADTSLRSVSIVEDVVGTLKWINDHSIYKLTEDTSPLDGKLYFLGYDKWELTKDIEISEESDYYTITSNLVEVPTKDYIYLYYELVNDVYIKTSDQEPQLNKAYYTLIGTLVDNPVVEDLNIYYNRIDAYQSVNVSKDADPTHLHLYEIDSVEEAVANYVSSHIALVDDGLYILNDDSGYKVLIRNNGIDIISDTNQLVAHYGSDINFDSHREYTIGNENTYFKYFDSDDDGIADAIQIKATSITIGDTIVESNIEEVNSNISDINTSLVNHAEVINSALTEISKYQGYIIINPEEPSISVGSSPYSFLKILPSKLSLVNDNIEVVYLSNERLYAPSAVVTNLYMQTINAETGETLGNVGWVMRSNGHLSLRPMK